MSLFPEVEQVQDPSTRETLRHMAIVIDMLMGITGTLSVKPPTPYEGQLARGTAGVLTATAGIHEYRAGTWQKL